MKKMPCHTFKCNLHIFNNEYMDQRSILTNLKSTNKPFLNSWKFYNNILHLQ